MIAVNPDRTRCPYEVGDILQTINSTPPAQRWPGTQWQQIIDRFVRGADAQHPAGSTGGSWTHAHAIEQACAYIRLNDQNTIETIDGGAYTSSGATAAWIGTRKVDVSGHAYQGSITQDRAVSVRGITQSTEVSPPYYSAYIWLRTG